MIFFLLCCIYIVTRNAYRRSHIGAPCAFDLSLTVWVLLGSKCVLDKSAILFWFECNKAYWNPLDIIIFCTRTECCPRLDWVLQQKHGNIADRSYQMDECLVRQKITPGQWQYTILNIIRFILFNFLPWHVHIWPVSVTTIAVCTYSMKTEYKCHVIIPPLILFWIAHFQIWLHLQLSNSCYSFCLGKSDGWISYGHIP